MRKVCPGLTITKKAGYIHGGRHARSDEDPGHGRRGSPGTGGSLRATATITGVVKDASGAVLPGVSVEVASPALTEKVRSVVTDGTGQYRIVVLPPGTYTVTVTLPGFNTVKREGIELTGTLTATIDADLRVGSLEETVTVTGETPIVDVQSARRQQVIDGDVLQAIPTSRSYNNVLQLVPGVVAGDGQVQLRPAMLLFTAHGGSAQDGRLTVDGINTGASRGGAGVSGYIPDMQNTAEVAFSISGNLGEAETGGPQMTVVPKSGGNAFTGSFFVSGLNDKHAGQQLRRRAVERARRTGQDAPAPRLSGVGRRPGHEATGCGSSSTTARVDFADAQPGIFANKNAGDPTKWTYEPDFSRQGRIDQKRKSRAAADDADDAQEQADGVLGRAAAVQRRRVDRSTTRCMQQQGRLDLRRKPDQRIFRRRAELAGDRRLRRASTSGCSRSSAPSPATNRLLLEAGFGTYISQWGYTERPGNPTANLVRVQEQSAQIFDRSGNRVAGACADCLTVGGNLKYRSSNWPTGYIFAHTWNASASYVTGAHNMKFGYQGAFHRDDDNLFQRSSTTPDAVRSTRREGRRQCQQRRAEPVFTIQAGPVTRKVRTEYYAFYAQEQWTKDRLTLQGALRFDRAWSSFPEQEIGPDVWIPTAIVLPAQQGRHGYNDISPRVGVAYDLFGNGKTSLKVNIGQIPAPGVQPGPLHQRQPVGARIDDHQPGMDRRERQLRARLQPARTAQRRVRRPPAAIDTAAHGWIRNSAGRVRRRRSISILSGWGARPYDWQFGVSVQQEVAAARLGRGRLLPPVVADLRRHGRDR